MSPKPPEFLQNWRCSSNLKSVMEKNLQIRYGDGDDHKSFRVVFKDAAVFYYKRLVPAMSDVIVSNTSCNKRTVNWRIVLFDMFIEESVQTAFPSISTFKTGSALKKKKKKKFCESNQIKPLSMVAKWAEIALWSK